MRVQAGDGKALVSAGIGKWIKANNADFLQAVLGHFFQLLAEFIELFQILFRLAQALYLLKYYTFQIRHFCSLEAIREVIKSVPQSEVLLRVLKAEVGDIGENDLKLAESAKAKVYGFRVKCPSNIQELADRRGVKVGCSSIIYELIQTIRLYDKIKKSLTLGDI